MEIKLTEDELIQLLLEIAEPGPEKKKYTGRSLGTFFNSRLLYLKAGALMAKEGLNYNEALAKASEENPDLVNPETENKGGEDNV